MKIRIVQYLKTGARFKPTEMPFETELTTENFNSIISTLGFKETSTPGHYWKRTAYDAGETIDIISN